MEKEGLQKLNNILFFVVIVSVLLYFGAVFLIPLTFGIFLATLMVPFANLLEKINLNRGLSSLISTIVVFVVVGGFSFLLLYQINRFAQDLPDIKNELQQFLDRLQLQITSLTGLSLEEQNRILQNRSVTITNSIEIYITRFLGSVLDTAIKFLLVLIYIFLMMLYREKFYDFVMMYIRKDKEDDSQVVLEKINKVVYQYLWGRIQVMTLLGIMYYITFIIFDIPYALLLTIFGSLITIIPYIGPFISGLLPIAFAILFGKDFYDVLIFSSIVIVIQLIESYVLEPVIIGKEVKLNPLTVIIAVILGGMTWGVAGMILFVPIFAMIKIISNHSSNLKPVGFLLGTTTGSEKRV